MRSFGSALLPGPKWPGLKPSRFSPGSRAKAGPGADPRKLPADLGPPLVHRAAPILAQKNTVPPMPLLQDKDLGFRVEGLDHSLLDEPAGYLFERDRAFFFGG